VLPATPPIGGDTRDDLLAAYKRGISPALFLAPALRGT
jgi:hypothetical protein